jgi:thymidylate synthase (FAD)
MSRPNSPELDSLIEHEVYEKILDHGILKVVDYMGNDQAIVDAARISYGAGTTKKTDNQGLLNYLMRHRHTTPFEMCEIKFYVKMPIFVARQWIRHRMASVNEYSARYSILDREFYLPTREQLAPQSKTNGQGKGGELSDREAELVLSVLEKDAKRCYSSYELMLNEYADGSKINEENVGIARELARMNLTLNHYTQWVWKIDLHNLFHFLALRMDSHAQYEIRVYADAIAEIVKQWVPGAYAAFEEYRLHAVSFSRKEMEALKIVLTIPDGQEASIPNYKDFSPGEWREFMAKIN